MLLATVIFTSALILGVYFYCSMINAYVYDSHRPGPTVLIICGTHGNEKAGTYAAKLIKDLIDSKKWHIQSGKLILIPNANPCGAMFNRRNNTFMNHDPNRKYGPNTLYPVNQVIMKFIQEASWIIDLHEGQNYRVHDVESLGNGMYFTTPDGRMITHEAVSSLNRILHTMGIPKFVTDELSVMPNALDDYARMYKKNYVLIETTGQDSEELLDIRASQHVYLVWSVLKQLLILASEPFWKVYKVI